MIRLRNVNVFMPESSRKVAIVQCLTALILIYFYTCSVSTQSLFITLNSICMLVNLLSVIICSFDLWLQQKQFYHRVFSYGFSRFEVLSVFVVVIIALLSTLDTLKECFLRILRSYPYSDSIASNTNDNNNETDHKLESGINTNGAFVIASILFIYQIATAFFFADLSRVFLSAMLQSGSNLLQDQLIKLHQSFTHSKLPHLSKLLLLRINPMLLFSFVMLLSSIILQLLAGFVLLPSQADTLVTLLLAPILIISFWPVLINSAFVLTQATPKNMISQLDQILTEISALEGVLEVFDHHFWSLTYGIPVGTLHIKVRRDAKEQFVLSQILCKFPMVSRMTIQISKKDDDWLYGLNKQAPQLPDPIEVSALKKNASQIVPEQNFGPITIDQQQQPQLQPQNNNHLPSTTIYSMVNNNNLNSSQYELNSYENSSTHRDMIS